MNCESLDSVLKDSTTLMLARDLKNIYKMHWMHLVCQKHNCTNTQSRNEKRQILFDYELCKHLATPVLGRLLVPYLSFLARKVQKLQIKDYRKLEVGNIVCNCLFFMNFFVSSRHRLLLTPYPHSNFWSTFAHFFSYGPQCHKRIYLKIQIIFRIEF